VGTPVQRDHNLLALAPVEQLRAASRAAGRMDRSRYRNLDSPP
jgi:hypothetical protein